MDRRFFEKRPTLLSVVLTGSITFCGQLEYRQAVPAIYILKRREKNLRECQGKWTQAIPAVVDVERGGWSHRVLKPPPPLPLRQRGVR